MDCCHIWLRAETKPNEQRRALTPDKCRLLLEKGTAQAYKHIGRRRCPKGWMCKFSAFDAEVSEIVAPSHFKYIFGSLQKLRGPGVGGDFRNFWVGMCRWNPQPIPELVQLNFPTLY